MDITKLYEEVVVGNTYDLAIAGQHNISLSQTGIKANEMPKVEERFVKSNHVGCCLHYSMYLISLLHKAGIKCYFTTTPEEDGANHCSVLYFDEKGDKFIADPVEDVKEGTVNKHMCINYEEFVSNAIRHEIAHYDVFGLNGEEAFFDGFLFNGKL